MALYIPPFKITPKIIKVSEDIAYELGRLTGEKAVVPSINLRRSNQIKTIQASLAIEGNTLSLKQVTDILEGKSVFGPQKDILEVKNAIDVYGRLKTINPLNPEDLLNAHAILMKGLVDHSGRFRTEPVGIYKEGLLAHLAPPAHKVEHLILELLQYIEGDTTVSWLIKSCIFHYEFEFIHPFMDGNGRMGRLWQQLLLMKHHMIFEYVPVEEIVRHHQSDYYAALGACDKAGESTVFIEFMVDSILEALKHYSKDHGTRLNDANARLRYAQKILGHTTFSRQKYREIHRNISDATASRDLKHGVDQTLLTTLGTHNQTHYRFV